MACGRSPWISLALASAAGLLVLGTSGRAEAANPIYYNNLADYQADVTNYLVDDYSDPGYVFLQDNVTMSGVVGETDYESTGHTNINIITNMGADPRYCAGCNGSFLLSFQTTSIGSMDGVNGVGFDIDSHSNTYYAFITFADGTTDNIALPSAGNFWGVSAPERIESIHVGLSMGGTTTGGSISIDNLHIGDYSCTSDADCPADSNPCTDSICNMGLCDVSYNTDPCDDGSMCSVNDTCDMGACLGMPADCDDTNECTTDLCDPMMGCLHNPIPGPCDDGDACTEDDQCAAGICLGSDIQCMDDDVCSNDSCDPEVGCVFDPVTGCCSADEDCALDEMCDVDNNVCIPMPSSDDSTGGIDPDTGTGGGGSDVGDTGPEPGGSDGGPGTTSGYVTGFDSLGEAETGLGGCTCTTDGRSGSSPWWLMGLLGLVARRRRRRRAA